MTCREREWLEDIAAIEDAIEQYGLRNVGLRVNAIVNYTGLLKSRVLKVLNGAIYNLDQSPIFCSRQDPSDARFNLWRKLCH